MNKKTRIMKILQYVSAAIILLTVMNKTVAQDSKTEKRNQKRIEVHAMVESRNFNFVPNSFNSMNGGIKQVTADYSVKLNGNNLVCYLPYIGRAYIAPINSSDNPMDFTSNSFTYVANPSKNKGWDISIKPLDHKSINQLSFRIFDNGSASLSVTSINRDPITYQGYLEANQKK